MNIKIEELIKLLPEGYQKECFETKAIERQRKIKTQEEHRTKWYRRNK